MAGVRARALGAAIRKLGSAVATAEGPALPTCVLCREAGQSSGVIT